MVSGTSVEKAAELRLTAPVSYTHLQLRGRVGRSNKKAYCYLLAPSPHLLPDLSRKRLQAIEQFSDLGSGIHIAMKDLDIRGAGDLLGAEQSLSLIHI